MCGVAADCKSGVLWLWISLFFICIFVLYTALKRKGIHIFSNYQNGVTFVQFKTTINSLLLLN